MCHSTRQNLPALHRIPMNHAGGGFPTRKDFPMSHRLRLAALFLVLTASTAPCSIAPCSIALSSIALADDPSSGGRTLTGKAALGDWTTDAPGFLILDCRFWIGDLRPSGSQSEIQNRKSNFAYVRAWRTRARSEAAPPLGGIEPPFPRARETYTRIVYSTARVKGAVWAARFFCGGAPFFTTQKNQKNREIAGICAKIVQRPRAGHLGK